MFRQGVNAALILVAGLMALGLLASQARWRATASDPRSEELYRLYAELCSTVREQSNEDAALGCEAWRVDPETVKQEIANYSRSLCSTLNQACQATENASRIQKINRFALLAECREAMPACHKGADEQTPMVIGVPQSCKAIGASVAVAKVYTRPGGAVVRFVLVNAAGKQAYWTVEVSVVPSSPDFVDAVQQKMGGICDDARNAQSGTFEQFMEWLGKKAQREPQQVVPDKDKWELREGAKSACMCIRG